MFEIYPREVKTVKYWFHLGIISAIFLVLVNVVDGPVAYTLKNWAVLVGITAVADIIAHSLLKLD